MKEWTPEIAKALAAPFKESDVSWVVVATSNKNTPQMTELWAPYVEAEPILDRLDDVVGPGGWSLDIEVVGDRSAICRLTILGVTKAGAGQIAAEQKTDQPFKAAATDALKRAAVLFGIGRYLHDKRLNEWRKPTADGARPKRGAAPKAPPPAPRPSPDPGSPPAQAATPEAPRPAEPAKPPNGQPLPPGQQAFQDMMKAHGLDLAGACELLKLWAPDGDKSALSNHIGTIKARKGCDSDTAWKAAADALSEAVAKRDLTT